MSLGSFRSKALLLCFPRVSGDEPATPAALMAATTFSPRERG